MSKVHGRFRLASLLIFALAISATQKLHAFCYVPSIRLDDEFFVSDVVFAGQIVGDEKIGLTPEGFFEARKFTWRVDRVFRGSIHLGDRLVTYTTNTSARFPLDSGGAASEVGRSFLIFASATNGKEEWKGMYAVDSCGSSATLAKSAAHIREINDLKYKHGSLLYGSMMDGDANVLIEATGPSGTYKAKTNERGSFSIHLPPGKYNVQAKLAGHEYADTDIAYKSSKGVSIPDGGSAGLSFREKSH